MNLLNPFFILLTLHLILFPKLYKIAYELMRRIDIIFISVID